MKFEDHGDFRKDIHRLLKRFKSLEEDVNVVRKVLTAIPDERPPLSYRMTQPRSDVEVINIGITCKCLKGYGVSSGLRLIYAFFRDEKRIMMMGMLHKNDHPSWEKRVLNRKF